MIKLHLINRKFNFSILILLCLIFTLFSCQSNNKAHQNDPCAKITEVFNRQVIAWNKADIKGFMQGYDVSDSLQFITKKGRTLGWDNVLKTYIKYYPTKKEMGSLQFNNLIVKPLSDSIAQVYGNWLITKESSVGGNFSLIMKQKPDGWKIIIDHTW